VTIIGKQTNDIFQLRAVLFPRKTQKIRQRKCTSICQTSRVCVCLIIQKGRNGGLQLPFSCVWPAKCNYRITM